MKWRRVPPVLSPIAASSLLSAAGAALGVVATRRDMLEHQLSTTFDARETLLTDSGTSALVLALRATVPPGEVVALPGYACIDLIAASIRAGVRVRLYDIDPETLGPDLDSLRETLDRGARAIVVAPLYGYPPSMTSIAELASQRGVPLIEDSAQGAGGVVDGRRLGAFGDLSVLSFGRGKGTTAGSGGALLVRQARFVPWASKARAELRAPARGARETIALAAQWMLARPLLYSIPASIPALRLGEMVYHPAEEPRALSAAAAATLRIALAIDAAEVHARRQHAEELITASAHSRRFAAIRPVPGATPGYLRFAMLDSKRIASLEARLGAMRGYPITLDEHAMTRTVLIDQKPTLTGARVLRDRLFTLPTHSRVAARDQTRLANWLASDPGAGILPAQATGVI